MTLENITDRKPGSAGALDKRVSYEADADNNGAAEFKIIPSGVQLSLNIFAQDDKGVDIADRTITVPLWGRSNDFLVRTDKAVYRSGDTMKLTALGDGILFVDLIHEGQTLLTGPIEMFNGQGEASVDLPPDLSGTVQVVGYRVDAKGWPQQERPASTFVRPIRSDIAATLDPGKKAYKPGDRPTLRLNLRTMKASLVRKR